MKKQQDFKVPYRSLDTKQILVRLRYSLFDVLFKNKQNKVILISIYTDKSMILKHGRLMLKYVDCTTLQETQMNPFSEEYKQIFNILDSEDYEKVLRTDYSSLDNLIWRVTNPNL
jgi:hypothetical protein